MTIVRSNPADDTYMKLVRITQDTGTHSGNRTGVDTVKTFGEFMRFNVLSNYPLLTQKKVFHRGIHRELFWFLDGENNIQGLLDDDVHIWDEWANANGDLGPVYGEQWRYREDLHLLRYSDPYFETKKQFLDSLTFTMAGDPMLQGQQPFSVAEICNGLGLLYYRKFDQITNALYRLQHYPDCRRIIVDGWNPSVVPVDGLKPNEQPAIGKQALPACHTLFQFGSADVKGIGRYRAEMKYMDIEEHESGEAYLFGMPTGLTLDTLTANKNVLIQKAHDHDREFGPLFKHRQLSLHLHQRSMDEFLGGPFNIASYASMLNLFASRMDMLPCNLTISVGDAHVYDNHKEQFNLQATQPHHDSPIFCAINVRKHADLKGLTSANYKIVGYTSGPLIAGVVAV